jgi:hypothetical protein
MANKAAPKKMTKKEMEEAKKRRTMLVILAVLMVGIMLLGVLLQFLAPSQLRVQNTNETQKVSTFNNIVDALKYLPEPASYVRFANLTANDVLTGWSVANIGHNLPNASMFGKLPYRDVVASFPYPTMGYAYVDNPQVVVLSDFGQGYDNASYQQTSLSGYQMRIIRDPYAFSTDSYPTIIGRKEYVATIDNFIKANTATANTAAAKYADLIEQTNGTASNDKFAVVGTTAFIDFGDRYYAGITPINATMCDYKIVVHLNQTLNESRMNDISLRWQIGAGQYGIDANAPQFKDNYVIMAARGDIESCLNDMASSNWYFIKEQS